MPFFFSENDIDVVLGNLVPLIRTFIKYAQGLPIFVSDVDS